MKKQMVVACLLAWVAVFCLSGSSEAVRYRYENLGTLGGNQNYTNFDDKELGINDVGQVVGISYTAGGALHAFLKSPGTAMQDLPLLSGTSEAHAPCINHSGLIGGWYINSGNIYACKWELLPGPIYQCTVVGGTPGQVYGSNDAGYLVGYGGNPSHAYVAPPAGPPQDLGALPGDHSSKARGINSANTIVGVSYDNNNVPNACIWTYSNGAYSAAAPLFGVANSWALAINSSGQAVGEAFISSADTYHAVLKSPGQALQDLETENSASGANDINDSGWVVGYPGFLWTPASGRQNLANLVVNPPVGVYLTQPMAINNRGEIAGYSWTGTGYNGVFKLIPIPEPPLSLLLED
jgi:probable HAF family extracellular repeat protein